MTGRCCLLGLVVLAIPIYPLSADDPPGWKTFTSADGGFTVLLPGTPKEQKQTVPSQHGPVAAVLYSVQAGETFHGAAYSEVPAVALQETAKKLLDGTRDGAVMNVKGKLLSEKDVKLDEHPGREFQVEIPGEIPVVLRTRIYVVKKRLLQVLVVGPAAHVTGPEVETFLQSLKLTPRPGTCPPPKPSIE